MRTSKKKKTSQLLPKWRMKNTLSASTLLNRPNNGLFEVRLRSIYHFFGYGNTEHSFMLSTKCATCIQCGGCGKFEHSIHMAHEFESNIHWLLDIRLIKPSITLTFRSHVPAPYSSYRLIVSLDFYIKKKKTKLVSPTSDTLTHT